MTERSDTEVLKILYDNAIEHRKHMLNNLARQCRTAANLLQDIAANAAHLAVEGSFDSPKPLGDVMEALETAKSLYPAILEAKVMIGNVDQFTHGRFKTKLNTPKASSNVTQLPRKPEFPTQAKGSASSTGKDNRADNPGRERQRRRKQSQNDG